MLPKVLASQTGLDVAMSLQGDDALTLVDILDRVSGLRIIGGHCSTPYPGTPGPEHGA